ncbi:glutathionylspermidine synthase preATP-grasp domain-containing protein [Hirsutella rhossiliensis]|uniref:Glutathionylspermidine synthase preATP-grasp domain-containing protein n=1 Tax=Hirsutella rhossiliensis TaxID=111463 RepID=A0A9P8SGK3_9HYPO|nr:glutathionylspermidine synthase preATP-grasp domain-containing protein [Hirsutella rhossiliensis]KAH0961876.1 glutathionylspermidine synthase preATP-grasp domain-containing protein [Hirsutella rhossiliensis]
MKGEHITLPALQLAAAAFFATGCQAAAINTGVTDCVDKGNKAIEANKCDGAGPTGTFFVAQGPLAADEAVNTQLTVQPVNNARKAAGLFGTGGIVRRGFGKRSPQDEARTRELLGITGSWKTVEMRRVAVESRPNATLLVQSQGLVYTNPADSSDPTDNYWPDDRYYSFTSEEIELLKKAGQDVFDMCCEAADYLVDHPETITSKMKIPAFALRQIIESWDREPAWGSVYGRFDICFGGLDHPDPRLRVPKFYEFNADTPTSLVEAASIQWLWLEQTGCGNDQYNCITEELITAWKRNLRHIEEKLGHRPTVHFAVAEGDDTGEDTMNTALLLDTCQQAGWSTKTLLVEDIGLGPDGRFYDKQNEHIDVIFKLYPWEMMVEQDFAEACFKDMETVGRCNEDGEYTGGTVWIEAPYKMLWSNKAIFAILWDLFKDDPRSKWLLPTFFDNEAPASLTKFARKPIFAREGADIVLQADGQVIQDMKTGVYGKEGYIVQELALLPSFKDNEDDLHYPVVGLWFVDGDPVGIGVREDVTPITTNGSAFIPHSISDGPVSYERQPIPELEEIEASLRMETYHSESAESKPVLTYIESVLA